MKLFSIGIDDCYFPYRLKSKHMKTCIVGCLCENLHPREVTIEYIRTDTLDATTAIVQLIEKLLQLYPIDVVFLDGITYGGFNIVDPVKLWTILNIPIVVVFRRSLDLDKIFKALTRHFLDYSLRYSIIYNVYNNSKEVTVGRRRIRTYAIGMSMDKIVDMLKRLRAEFLGEPYPLKLADMLGYEFGMMIAADAET